MDLLFQFDHSIILWARFLHFGFLFACGPDLLSDWLWQFLVDLSGVDTTTRRSGFMEDCHQLLIFVFGCAAPSSFSSSLLFLVLESLRCFSNCRNAWRLTIFLFNHFLNLPILLYLLTTRRMTKRPAQCSILLTHSSNWLFRFHGHLLQQCNKTRHEGTRRRADTSKCHEHLLFLASRLVATKKGSEDATSSGQRKTGGRPET